MILKKFKNLVFSRNISRKQRPKSLRSYHETAYFDIAFSGFYRE